MFNKFFLASKAVSCWGLAIKVCLGKRFIGQPCALLFTVALSDPNKTYGNRDPRFLKLKEVRDDSSSGVEVYRVRRRF
jgi:hypothetical protein